MSSRLQQVETVEVLVNAACLQVQDKCQYPIIPARMSHIVAALILADLKEVFVIFWGK